MKLTAVKQRLSPLAVQNLTLILAGLLVGIFLAVRWKDVEASPSTNANNEMTTRERVSQAIQQSEREQEQLKATIANLREQLPKAQRQAAKNAQLSTTISRELESERMVAGLTALQGPGVVVYLDDSRAVPLPGTDAGNYIIHDGYLRDLVNLLWNAGAEAISINDERLVNTTSIYCVGTTVMVNDTRLSPPYEVRVIGDRVRLQPLLENPNYLSELRGAIQSYGVQFKVSWAPQVEVPAYSGSFRLRYTHTGEITP